MIDYQKSSLKGLTMKQDLKLLGANLLCGACVIIKILAKPFVLLAAWAEKKAIPPVAK